MNNLYSLLSAFHLFLLLLRKCLGLILHIREEYLIVLKIAEHLSLYLPEHFQKGGESVNRSIKVNMWHCPRNRLILSLFTKVHCSQNRVCNRPLWEFCLFFCLYLTPTSSACIGLSHGLWNKNWASFTTHLLCATSYALRWQIQTWLIDQCAKRVELLFSITEIHHLCANDYIWAVSYAWCGDTLNWVLFCGKSSTHLVTCQWEG